METSPQTYTIDLEPVGRRIAVEPGTDLLSAAQRAGVDLVAACGGVGICGTCLVRLVTGKLTPPTLTEEEELGKERLAEGYRMACQAEPLSDVRLDIPPGSLPAAQKMQVEGRESAFTLDPAVKAVDLALTPPELEDLRSDLTRTSEELASLGLPPLQGDLAAFTALSEGLRGHGWKVRLALRREKNHSHLAAVLPPGTPLLGLAVDLGSTKLALYLIDLNSGTTLASTGVMNPQIAYGEDVVSRIAYANKRESNRHLLQTRLVDTLNEVIVQLCAQVGAHPQEIVEAVMVGNTAMHHFLCGLPVAQLGASPYIPAVSQPLLIKAVEVGLNIATSGSIYMPANIAGYVGADHTAALLASRAHKDGRTFILVDIGTNTEISLARGELIFTCSTASGPAFEGAHIQDGMRAAPGAIERVLMAGGEVQTVTIGGLAPVGLCGTGILTAISEMLENSVLDMRGVFDRSASRVRTVERRAEFVLVPASKTGHGRDVVVTRKDVHEIQLAKGAIRAGIGVLLDEAGITAEDVDEWVIAGAFGTYLDLRSAQRVGMFPPVPLERFQQVGNAAGVGAKEMLLSQAKRNESFEMTARVRYVELTIFPDFSQRFVDAMYFSSMTASKDERKPEQF
jgi:uncharacterized 2Fe-2S/4Fe-4S cluster protein (DUF4445 family)